MIYSLLFVAHIAGAVITGFFGGLSVFALWKGMTERYTLSALVLGAIATFEIVTGTTLSILSAQVSAVSVCERVLVYLSFVAVIEVLLFARMQKVSLGFPVAKVASPVAASLLMLLTAVAYGF